jgi:endonuclease/exonuclease/phosphatase family metal-dependent hydrolase
MSRITYIIFVILLFTFILFPQNKTLKVLTVNVWSGLDYRGTFSFGEYENDETREKRFDILLAQIKQHNPDIIFTQESNPVAAFASKLAEELDFDEIHQVSNAGIKFGPLGIPSNFKEGLVILSRKNLQLEEYKVQKVAGSLGIYGDLLTIHFDESRFFLVGKIKVNDTPIYLINAHLGSEPPYDSVGVQKRKNEVETILSYITELNEHPVILAGDFNAAPESEEMKIITEGEILFDTFSKNVSAKKFTWNASKNTNIIFSANHFDARKEKLNDEEIRSADYDTVSRRIDYIFLNRKFLAEDVVNTAIILDSIINGVYASDHFGVLTNVHLDNSIQNSPKEYPTLTDLNDKTLEPLPIFSYDTDVGFGYGAKAFFLNHLELNESFDLVLFNSTKGERWYRFVFSIPDFELRQGKVYPFSLDFLADYDKWIKNSYFGIGNDSKFEDREYYTREPLELSLTASRGFTQTFIGQFGTRFKTTNNFNFEASSDSSSLINLPPEVNPSNAKYFSLFLNLRYDTRNSFINPTRGAVIQAEGEYAPDYSFTNVSFMRWGLTLQSYSRLFYPTTILALRLNFQNINGDQIPIQNLLSLGGNQTLRGYPQDRFLDKVAAVANAELRFPIFWRFGGVAGIDLGRVWNELSDVGFTDWHKNSNFGLRFYFETFIVRLDVGMSSETTGFYLNFGHVF